MNLLSILRVSGLSGLILSGIVFAGPPAITSSAPTEAEVGQAYSYQVLASDPEAGALTYELVFAPEGMAISFGGIVSWTPTAEASGNQSFKIHVEDQEGLLAYQYVDLAVSDPNNNVPLINQEPITALSVSDTYSYDLQVTDADNDALSYKVWSWPEMAGLAISDQGVVGWVPANRDAAGEYWITVEVSDGRLGIATREFKLTVTDPSNNVPVLTQEPLAAVLVGETYTYDVQASDGDNDVLSYDIWSWPNANGLQISSLGVVTWTPLSRDDAGEYWITIEANDGHLGNAKQQYLLTVSDPNNQAPVVVSEPLAEALANDVYRYEIQATDSENDSLSYSVWSWPAMPGLIVSDEGVITWTSSSRDDAGEYWITIEVNDGHLGTTKQEYKLNVIDGNNAIPVIAQSPITEALVGQPYTYDLDASDGDNDVLIYTLNTWPGNSAIQLSANGEVTWTPVRSNVGAQWISITVDDGHMGSATIDYTLNVTDPNNQNPIISSSPATQANVGVAYQYALSATDGNGDDVSFTLFHGPEGMILDPVTNIITWTPAAISVEGERVKVDAKDDFGGFARQDFLVYVGVDDGGNDSDGDGYPDDQDAFPNDPSEWLDTDGDAQGNNADLDDDNDGVEDATDAFPLDATETLDTDGDLIGNNADTDDDNDGVADTADAFPLDATESLDTDGDTIGNNADTDDDNDSVLDVDDAFPLDAAESLDTDGDAIGNNADTDDDNDGVADTADAFPLDATESLDTDGDAIGNNADTDDDNDGVLDVDDAFSLDPTESSDLDEDGIGDNSDPDRDGDLVANDSDAYPNDPTRSALPIVNINTPLTLSTVGETPITVTGVVAADATALTVNGTSVSFSSGQFSTAVSLQEGHNAVVARMVTASGEVSTSSIAVSLDTTPPYITVESHVDGQIVYDDHVSVSGLINDIVRGTIEESEATVTVNGTTASISNRGYLAEGIVLAPGVNTITVSGADQVGNTNQTSFTLDYQAPVGKRLEIAGGQGQTADVASNVGEPLAIRVLDDSGLPVSAAKVIFRVIQGAGTLSSSDYQGRAVIVDTDAEGVAIAQFTLGYRAGVGNQKVRARVVGYDDEQVFYASVTQKLGDKIGITAGNNQRGGVFQRLPSPLIVSVTDEGSNLVEGAPVLFQVASGGGYFENGEQELTVNTDADGRASAHFTLGAVLGLDKQRVVATLAERADTVPSNTIIRSVFTASGFVTGPAGDTTISGVILDNQSNPLSGTTIRVEDSSRQAIADSEGKFTITEAPVGPVHLIFDGSTVDAEGEYPTLSSNIVTVSGVDNPLTKPIYLVKLNMDNAVYAGLQDVSISLDAVPGFKLEIPAGSVTFPDGTKEGYVSVTMVNASAVPMAPPNGMQPKFIVTVQPTGAMFDAPARLTMPNVDGFLPGKQVEMFSFDHDLEEFAAIGFGTVSEDGKTITSNPGVGIVKAGWTCAAETAANGIPYDCEYCELCNGISCDPDPSKNGQTVPGPDCIECIDGATQRTTAHVQQNTQIPDDCLVHFCDGTTEPAPSEPQETSAQTPEDCKELLCDGSEVAVYDPPADPGWCEDPVCNGTTPGTVFNRNDFPEDNVFDCITVTGCSSGTSNGELHTFLMTQVDPDGGIGESEVDLVPGDCRKPGCTAGGWNGAGVTDLSDEPDPGNACQTCSLSGYPLMLNGAVPGAGSACTRCNNGQQETVVNGGRIDVCSECQGGVKTFSEGAINSCQQCGGNGELINLSGAIGSGSACVMCENGVEISNDCSSNGYITLIDKRDNNRIRDGETIFIGPEPSMPELEATVDYSSLPPANVSWNLTTEFPRRPAGGSRNCSDEHVDDKNFTSDLGVNDIWSIYEMFEFDVAVNFFGAADVSSSTDMQAQISATGASSIEFKIHGENPTKTQVYTKINAINQPPLPHLNLRQIALQESSSFQACAGDQMLQFNGPACVNGSLYDNTPNYGAPDGWGVMQIDNSSSCSGGVNNDPVRTNIVWNWDENIDSGIARLRSKRTSAISILEGIVRHYQAVNFIGFVLPPATVTINGVTLDIYDACTIQQYNGVAGVPSQPRLRAGSTISGTAKSCMFFDTSTLAWEFSPNINGYVQHVISR